MKRWQWAIVGLVAVLWIVVALIVRSSSTSTETGRDGARTTVIKTNLP
jgi:hypothetical protein